MTILERQNRRKVIGENVLGMPDTNYQAAGIFMILYLDRLMRTSS